MARNRAVLIRRTVYLLAALLVVGAAAWALWPQPASVEIAEVRRQPMRVMVEDEGISRIRDVYTVSMPLHGAVQRLTLNPGDPVVRGETVIAEIHPADPEFLDVRTRRVAEAAVDAARAAVAFAEARLREAVSAHGFAQAELTRARALADRQAIPQRTLDRAELDLASAGAAVASAEAQRELRVRELESAEARLIQPGQSLPMQNGCCLTIRAPIDGQVLRVIAESAQVLGPGQPILEIGDPGDIEIVVDLLSRDAVRAVAGAPAEISDWGGEGVLGAIVERIEPSAFTKVSALGIEEQRVRTILNLTDPPDRAIRLGHNFRVVVGIEVWRDDDALTVPLGALFRQGADWAVFREVDGRAVLTRVEIGPRTLRDAAVLGGLSEGDRVIVHPGDDLADGMAVVSRRIGA